MYARPDLHGRPHVAAHGYGYGGCCFGYVVQYLVLVFGPAIVVFHGANYEE